MYQQSISHIAGLKDYYNVNLSHTYKENWKLEEMFCERSNNCT